MTTPGQCCGTCRWRRGTRCRLRPEIGRRLGSTRAGGRKVRREDGRTCTLWDPREGEKLPPELRPTQTALADAQVWADGAEDDDG